MINFHDAWTLDIMPMYGPHRLHQSYFFTRECNKRALAALVSALMCDAQCMSLFVVDVGRCPSTTVDAALVFDRVSEAKYSPFPGSTPRWRILHQHLRSTNMHSFLAGLIARLKTCRQWSWSFQITVFGQNVTSYANNRISFCICEFLLSKAMLFQWNRSFDANDRL